MIGETVGVFVTDVDDSTEVLDDEVVDADGDVEIENYVRKAVIGLRYRWIYKPMRLDVMSQSGTTKGSIKRFAEVVVSFFKTRGAQYGRDTDNLHTITDLPIDGSDTFTGDTVVSADGGFGVEDDFVLSGTDPTPVVLRAIVPRVKKTGR